MNANFSSWQACPAKLQAVNIWGFMSHLVSRNSAVVVYASPLNSATVEKNQLLSICKRMWVTAFQQHVVYKSRWSARFGPWTILGLIPKTKRSNEWEHPRKLLRKRTQAQESRKWQQSLLQEKWKRRVGHGTVTFPGPHSGRQEQSRLACI